MNSRYEMAGFKRVTLLEGPTPIQRLWRLERATGGDVHIYAKRDDLMGLGGGGNKLRKLEFLLGDALSQGCDTIITTGGIQSNHARLTAASAAKVGLACELMLSHNVPRHDSSYSENGNLLLNSIFGANVNRVPSEVEPLEAARARARALELEGHRPYVVGLGGSSPVGCLGYVACAEELLGQEAADGLRFTKIVLPNGSGGTQAGLAAGLTVFGGGPERLEGFTVLDRCEAARQRTVALTRDVLDKLGYTDIYDESPVTIGAGQLGNGYGIPTEAMLKAVRMLARTEGLLVDPVYGGKALAGLLEAIHEGKFKGGDKVLFLMTGGMPGLFAYQPAFDELHCR